MIGVGWGTSCIFQKISNGPPFVDLRVACGHRGETYRVVTSVPTFFVRMLGKLLDACI